MDNKISDFDKEGVGQKKDDKDEKLELDEKKKLEPPNVNDYKYRYERICKPEDRGGEYPDGVPLEDTFSNNVIEIKPGIYIMKEDEVKLNKGEIPTEYVYENKQLTCKDLKSTRTGQSKVIINRLTSFFQELANIHSLGDDEGVEKEREHAELSFLDYCSKLNPKYKKWEFNNDDLRRYPSSKISSEQNLPPSRLWQCLGPEFVNLAKSFYESPYTNTNEDITENDKLSYSQYTDIIRNNDKSLLNNLDKEYASELLKPISEKISRVATDRGGFNLSKVKFINEGAISLDIVDSEQKVKSSEVTLDVNNFSSRLAKFKKRKSIISEFEQEDLIVNGQKYNEDDLKKLLEFKKSYNGVRDDLKGESELKQKFHDQQKTYKTFNPETVSEFNKYKYIRNIDYERFFDLNHVKNNKKEKVEEKEVKEEEKPQKRTEHKQKITIEYDDVPNNPYFAPLWSKAGSKSLQVKDTLVDEAVNNRTSGMISFILDTKQVQHTTPEERVGTMACLVVSGNLQGCVGFGYGKGDNLDTAQTKALNEIKSKSKLLGVDLYEDRTVFRPLYGKHNNTNVMILPAAPGRGIVACDTIWAILFSMGMKDCVTKILGHRNIYSVTMATFSALAQHESLNDYALKTGSQIEEIKKYKMSTRTRMNRKIYYGPRWDK